MSTTMEETDEIGFNQDAETPDDVQMQYQQSEREETAQGIDELSEGVLSRIEQSLVRQGGDATEDSQTVPDSGAPEEVSSPSASAVEPETQEGTEESQTTLANSEYERESGFDYETAADVVTQSGRGLVDGIDEGLEAMLFDIPVMMGWRDQEYDRHGKPVDHFNFSENLGFPEPKTAVGDFSAELVKFGVAFAGVGKLAGAIKGIPVATKFLTRLMASKPLSGTAQALANHTTTAKILKNATQGSIAGFAADFLVMNPNDERLADIASQNPVLAAIIPDFLVTDEDDSQFERRVDNAIEGALVGTVAGPVIGGITSQFKRLAQAVKRSRTTNGVGVINGVPEEVRQAVQQRKDELVAARIQYRSLDEATRTFRRDNSVNPALEEAIAVLRANDDVLPKRLEDVSDDAKAYLDSAETFAGQQNEPNLRRALEKQFNSQTAEKVAQRGPTKGSLDEALQELDTNGDEAMMGYIDRIRRLVDNGEELDVVLRDADQALNQAEKNWSEVLRDQNMREFDPEWRVAMQAEIDAPYAPREGKTRPYRNARSESYNHNTIDEQANIDATHEVHKTPRNQVDKMLGKYDDPGNILKNPDALTPHYQKQFRKAILSGDADEIAAVSEEIFTKTGIRPAYRMKLDGATADDILKMAENDLKNDTEIAQSYSSRTKSWRQSAEAGKRIVDSDEVTEEIYGKAAESLREASGADDSVVRAILRGDANEPLGSVKELEARVFAFSHAQKLMLGQMGIYERIGTSGLTTLQKAEYLNLMKKYLSLVRGQSQVASEAGRALRANAAQPTATRQLQAHYDDIAAGVEISEIGGEKALDELMTKVQALKKVGDAEVTSALVEMERAGGWEITSHIWMGGILSSIKTFAVNIGGNTGNMLYLPAEGAYGAMYRGDRKAAGQELAAYKGMFQGWEDAWRLSQSMKDKLPSKMSRLGYDAEKSSWKINPYSKEARALRERHREIALGSSLEEMGAARRALATGDSGLNQKWIARPDAARAKAQELRGQGRNKAAAAIGFLNLIPTMSYRGLAWGDAVSKTMNQQGRLRRNAVIAADKMGLGEAESAAFQSLAAQWGWRYQSIPEDIPWRNTLIKMGQESETYTARATFTDQNETNALLNAVKGLQNKLPVTRFFTPFANTANNLLKWPLERTPGLARISREYRDAFQMKDVDPDRWQAVQTRVQAGTMLWGIAGMAAASGRSTGPYPLDPAERNSWIARGIQPNALYVAGDFDLLSPELQTITEPHKGGEGFWLQYGRLEPFSTPFSMASNFYSKIGDMDEASINEFTGAGIFTMAEALTSKSWLKTVGDLGTVVMDSETRGKTAVRKLEQFAASFVPSIVNDVARTVDPTMKEANNLLEAFTKKIPFASRYNMGMTNLWNEPQQYPSGVGPDMANPLYSGTYKPDAAADAFKLAGVNINLRTYFSRMYGVELNSEEIAEYKRVFNSGLFGRTVKSEIYELVKSPEFAAEGPGRQKELIDGTLNAYKDKARSYVAFEWAGGERIREEIAKADVEVLESYQPDGQPIDEEAVLQQLLGQ